MTGVQTCALPIFARSNEIDVFIELIGGDEGPARESVRAALEAGRHVVTANKALLAKHGVALAEIARCERFLSKLVAPSTTVSTLI